MMGKPEVGMHPLDWGCGLEGSGGLFGAEMGRYWPVCQGAHSRTVRGPGHAHPNTAPPATNHSRNEPKTPQNTAFLALRHGARTQISGIRTKPKGAQPLRAASRAARAASRVMGVASRMGRAANRTMLEASRTTRRRHAATAQASSAAARVRVGDPWLRAITARPRTPALGNAVASAGPFWYAA